MVFFNICYSEQEIQAAYDIRDEVFVLEQGFASEIERDEFDPGAVHIIGYDDNSPVCCARIVFINNKIKLGRIAVRKAYRGMAYGKALCAFLVGEAKKSMPDEIYLEAQLYAVGFYEKCGFVTVGDIFQEEGVDHIKMIHEYKRSEKD